VGAKRELSMTKIVSKQNLADDFRAGSQQESPIHQRIIRKDPVPVIGIALAVSSWALL
jgi:hypothetical protein